MIKIEAAERLKKSSEPKKDPWMESVNKLAQEKYQEQLKQGQKRQKRERNSHKYGR